MAFVGLTIAGAVSAAPSNTVPNPFAPKPVWQWQKIDQGSKYFQNMRWNQWDDQKLNYRTYKFRYNWRFNNNNHVKIYMQLFDKKRNNMMNPWAWNWALNKSTVKSLDKNNRFQLKINTVTYNSTGNEINNTNQTIFTRYNAVQFYWIFKNRLITR